MATVSLIVCLPLRGEWPGNWRHSSTSFFILVGSTRPVPPRMAKLLSRPGTDVCKGSCDEVQRSDLSRAAQTKQATQAINPLHNLLARVFPDLANVAKNFAGPLISLFPLSRSPRLMLKHVTS